MPVRRIIGCLLTIPLTCAAIIALIWAYNFFITQFGRITAFTPLTTPGKTSIPGSDYAFAVTQDSFFIDHISLVNNTTHQGQEISVAIASEEYASFNYDGKLYVVFRSYGGGSNGAFDYDVIDISGIAPRLIGEGQACSNPRLNGDSLEFYRVPGKCDFFPFGREISTWQLKLNEVGNSF